MTLFNIPALDPSSSDEGVWKEFMNGVSFKIARYGNTAHALSMQQILNSHKEDPDATELGDEVAESLVTFILLDWKGLTTPEGEPIPYSKEVALELLTKDEYIHVQTFVEKTSRDMANYYVKEKKETAEK